MAKKATAAPRIRAEVRRVERFDAGWRFQRGEVAGAEVPEFDDSGWRRLDLPHDWSVEDLPPLAKEKPA